MILLLVVLLATNISYSQNEIEDLRREIQKVSDSQKKILNEFAKLRKDNKYQNDYPHDVR